MLKCCQTEYRLKLELFHFLLFILYGMKFSWTIIYWRSWKKRKNIFRVSWNEDLQLRVNTKFHSGFRRNEFDSDWDLKLWTAFLDPDFLVYLILNFFRFSFLSFCLLWTSKKLFWYQKQKQTRGSVTLKLLFIQLLFICYDKQRFPKRKKLSKSSSNLIGKTILFSSSHLYQKQRNIINLLISDKFLKNLKDDQVHLRRRPFTGSINHRLSSRMSAKYAHGIIVDLLVERFNIRADHDKSGPVGWQQPWTSHALAPVLLKIPREKFHNWIVSEIVHVIVQGWFEVSRVSMCTKSRFYLQI